MAKAPNDKNGQNPEEPRKIEAATPVEIGLRGGTMPEDPGESK